VSIKQAAKTSVTGKEPYVPNFTQEANMTKANARGIAENIGNFAFMIRGP
jgi:hypothetical protein